MTTKSERKILASLTQPQYGLLRDLTDMQPLDAARLETEIAAAVADRIGLAKSLLETAKLLMTNSEALVRRSAASRAYYAAYQMARAVIFSVQRRDQDDHDSLPGVLDSLDGLEEPLGPTLKELRKLRNEMDYSPYPGPDSHTQYDADEIDVELARSVERSERLLTVLQRYLERRQ